MTEIIQAAQAHQWLVLAVLAWPIVLAFGQRVGGVVDMSRLPSWAQWLIGQGVAGVSVFVALVAQGVYWPDAALAGLMAAAGVEWTATAGKRLGRAIGGGK